MISTFKLIGNPQKRIERIVSIAPSFTDTLAFLEQESKIVGVTENCRFGNSAQTAKIGAFGTPDITTIRELKPDLILGIGTVHSRHLTDLQFENSTLLLLEANTVEGILETIEGISDLIGVDQSAKDKINILKKRLRLVEDTVKWLKPPRVFRLINDNPITTPTTLSYQYDAMKLAGGLPMPIASSSAYTEVKTQDINAFDPEIIFSCGLKEGDERSQRCAKCLDLKPPCIRIVDDVISMEGFGNTTGGRNHRIFTLYCELSCHPGPFLIDGIEEMARAFHPGAFYSSKIKRIFI